MEVLDRIGQLGILPVVKIDDASRASQLADTLLKGGLPCAEITFRTAAADAAIREIVYAYPQMLTGAGTVITVGQAKLATDSGARFIVSPGISVQVIEWCLAHEVPVIPGVATPTDIMTALGYGLDILKFFPAENLGGVQTLKALSAPFEAVRFIPTGGINMNNLESYLKLSCVHACGGSWFVSPSLISSGNFQEIIRGTKEAIEIIKRYRGLEVGR